MGSKRLVVTFGLLVGLLSAGTVYAQAAGAEPSDTCSKKVAAAYQKKVSVQLAAFAELGNAEQAFQSGEDHQNGLDAQVASSAASALGSVATLPASIQSGVKSSLERQLAKVSSKRKKDREKTLKALKKTLDAARAKADKADKELRAAVPKGCTL